MLLILFCAESPAIMQEAGRWRVEGGSRDSREIMAVPSRMNGEEEVFWAEIILISPHRASALANEAVKLLLILFCAESPAITREAGRGGSRDSRGIMAVFWAKIILIPGTLRSDISFIRAVPAITGPGPV